MVHNFGALLARHPVIMAIYGVEQLKVAIESEAKVCIIANIDLLKIQPVINLLTQADKFVIVNIDSCNGIQQDKSGIEYIAESGATGILSTRLQTIQRANRLELLTMQKIFVTDRSTWLRSLNAIEQSAPDYVQLMPAPMLPLLSQADKMKLPPTVASGFVSHANDVTYALANGAIAVSSSDCQLWGMALSPEGKIK